MSFTLHRYGRVLMPLLLALGLSACSMHPLGIDDKEWAAMSQADQMRAYEKQAELDKVRAQEQADIRRAELDAEARKVEAMAELRRNARYGDIVQCVLDADQLRVGGKWRAGRAEVFDLVRGESRSIRLSDKDDRYSRDAHISFAENGLEVQLCPEYYRGGGHDGCARLLGTSREFRKGISSRIAADDFLRGNLRCDLKPLPGRAYYR